MIFTNKAGRLIYALNLLARLDNKRGLVVWLQRVWGKTIYHFYSVVTASDIALRAKISPKARFRHMTGVVIHPNAVVEDDCLIMQQVTLGVNKGPGAPHVRRGAFIGAGAKVLGAVTIGEYAKVGANAVVLSDVAPYTTVVGIPARVVGYPHTDRPTNRDAPDMVHAGSSGGPPHGADG